ncbi:helix-turn-helix transcriptional regulator [Ensifer sp. YR511]|uniref:helix-turn-helix transcriptional regulator n=1 Tax=Ensifer sp. YR511 TaxID=1855294 RepID=UPI0015A35D1A|nr:helix-turn-helix transcriptional regulator [Ensifer sp. YR511]
MVEAGTAIAVAGGQTFDILNTPDIDTNLYEAEWLVCDPAIVAGFADRNAAATPIQCVHALSTFSLAFHEAFQHAQKGVFEEAHVPTKAAIARIVEMLAWLDQSGGYFRNPVSKSMSDRVRRVFGEDLSAKWLAPAVAKHLGVSEATLRRRLAVENTSFNSLLIDARMNRALTLLQVTDLPVTQIAFQIGYESASRFSARFRARFGCSPSAVRSPE